MNVTQAIRDVRRHLGGDRSLRLRLANNYTAVATDLVTLEAVDGVTPGMLLELQGANGQEVVYVWAVDTATKTLTVERGQEGTTALAFSTGERVVIKPRYFTHEIRDRLQEELRFLEAEGLYAAKTTTLTYDDFADAYDTSAVTDLLSPYLLEVTDHGRTKPLRFLHRDGYIRPFDLPPNDTATLHYRGGFAPFVTDADDLQDVCGLPDSAHDLLPLGTAYRLLIGREAVRLDEQSKQFGRGDEGLPAGSITGLARHIAAIRAVRLSQELDRQYRKWPVRGV